MKLLDANPHGRYRYPRRICATVFHSAGQERFCRGGINVQKYFRSEFRRIQVDVWEFDWYGMAINDLSGQRSIIVVVAGKMFVIGAGMVICGARRTMAGSFDMQKTYFYSMRSRKTCFFNLMCNRKDRIYGETDHHRYQSQCDYFFEFQIQAVIPQAY